MKAKPNNLLLIFAGILCLTASYFSVVIFWADIINVRPTKVMSAFDKKEPFNQALALNMVSRVKQSINVNPNNANSHLLLARYYEKLHFETPLNQQLNQQYAPLAEQSYKTAITLQPTGFMAWAQLANFHSQQIDFLNNQQPISTTMAQALSRHQQQFAVTFWQAVNLGAFEDYSQRLTIPLIFKHWPALSQTSENKAKLIHIIKSTLKSRRHPRLALDSAKKYHQLDVLTPLVKKKWSINRLKTYQAQTQKEQQRKKETTND